MIAVIDVEELRALIREELRAALATPKQATVDPASHPFLTVARYASLLGLSKRHVENLIREGLPLVGQGRGRRVDCAAALAWMRARSRRADDPVALAQESIARVAQRRARK